MANPQGIDIFKEYISKNPEGIPAGMSPETFNRYKELATLFHQPQQSMTMAQQPILEPIVPDINNQVPMQQPMQQQPQYQEPMFQPPPTQSYSQPVVEQPMPMPILPQQMNGFGRQQNALENIGEIEGQKAAKTAELYGPVIQEIEKSNIRKQERDLRYQQDVDNSLNDYNKTIADMASAKIDPQRFWNSKTMPDKISAFIGIMLSGIGAGMQGVAGNSALNVINNAIDQDIGAQKLELQNKANVLGYKQNLFGMMRNKYGDESMAEAATKAAMLEKMQMQMNQQAALYEIPLVKERAQLGIGQLQQEKAKYDTEMGLKFQELALRRQDSDRNYNLNVMKFGAAQDQARQVALEKQQAENEELSVGNLGVAKTKQEAIKARDTLRIGRSFIKKIDKLIELRKDHGTQIFPTEAKSLMDSIYGQLTADYKSMETLGTLDRGVLQLFDRVIKHPAEYGYRLKQYEEFRKNAVKDLEENIKSKLRTGGSGTSVPLKTFQPTR